MLFVYYTAKEFGFPAASQSQKVIIFNIDRMDVTVSGRAL
jgi:hypothetical protein